jgi:hypothetical protein
MNLKYEQRIFKIECFLIPILAIIFPISCKKYMIVRLEQRQSFFLEQSRLFKEKEKDFENFANSMEGTLNRYLTEIDNSLQRIEGLETPKEWYKKPKLARKVWLEYKQFNNYFFRYF